ncbi:MAG: hypothetical protein JNK87_40070 [Bryobacterales bacterium]|nr:hypothetical protein [Bryobacterales bacterium]
MNTLWMMFWVVTAGWAGDARIVCFGDSTTAPREGVVPYCEQIRAVGRETVNRGVRGNTTEHGRERFAADVLAVKPDVVILQFGINDSTVDVWKSPPAKSARVTVARFRENLTYFVESLKSAGARVVLMTFNPLAWTEKMTAMYGKAPYQPGEPMGFNAGREPYLQAIREVARQQGVVLVDVDAAFREYAATAGQSLNDLLLDGIHPNTRGHEVVARLLSARGVLPPTR